MPVDFAEIRRRQEAAKLTNQEAGVAAGREPGRARQWWGDLISGRKPDPQLSTLEGAARALKCRVQDLLTEDTPGGRGGRRGIRS
ncbi:MAG TPA: hypothetical protein VF796_16015 [Humisphaera sp.]